jgi:NAD(P)H-dependent flavin oxidoreductase YrpB (nitropropane dioxygenase family)
VEQAERALAEGADGLIAQALGAGGHLLGDTPLDQLMPAVIKVAGPKPVIVAGGIHDATTAANARAAGASGVSAGTRFLLTPESHAHDAYKARLLAARTTLVTLLFGLGWHGVHRVVPNAATRRWCEHDALGPRWVRAMNRATQALTRVLPASVERRYVPRQRISLPLYTPAALLRGMDERLLEVTPLYAGQCVTKIAELLPAAAVVSEIARGWSSG